MRKSDKKYSLHRLIRKHFYITITIPILVLATFLYITQMINYQMERDFFLENTLNIAKSQIDSFIDYHKNILVLFANTPTIFQAQENINNTAEIDEVIYRFDERYSFMGSMALGLEDGRMFSKNVDNLPKSYDPRVRPWYKMLVDSGQSFIISNPYINAVDSSKINITLSQSVLNETREFVGVAGLDIDMNQALDFGNNLKLNQDTTIILVDASGNILAANGNRESTIEKEILKQVMNQKNEELIKPFSIEDLKIYSILDNETGWWIIVYSSNQFLKNNQINLLLICFLLILLFEAIGFFYVRRLDRKLIEPLDRVVKHIETFDFSNPIESLSSLEDGLNETIEVTKLRLTFNELSSRLYQEHEALLNGKAEIADQYMEIESFYEETTAMNETLNEVVDNLHESWKQTVRVLSNAIEANDEYTKGHCDRVKNYALTIARSMDLDKPLLEQLEFAALLHDVGKVAVPYHILNKEGALTQEEREIVWKHPLVGYNIIEGVQFLDPVAKIILNHHECPDGSGYPDRKIAKDIPLSSLILSVADAYDAMTSARSYRKIPLTKEQAFNELIKHSGTQFDANIVDIALKNL